MNAIDTILIIPYSALTCQYYINGSVDAHATTYDKITEMVSKLAPWSVYTLDHNLSRRLSFFINIKEKTIQEVRPDQQEVIDQNRKEKLEMNQSVINKFFVSLNNKKVDNAPKHNVLLNTMQSKLWRK